MERIEKEKAVTGPERFIRSTKIIKWAPDSERVLMDWTPKLKKRNVLVVEGDLYDPSTQSRFRDRWSSSRILKASKRRLSSKSGSVYVLEGPMALDSLGNLPEYIRTNFTNGFPRNWKSYVKKWVQEISPSTQKTPNASPTILRRSSRKSTSPTSLVNRSLSTVLHPPSSNKAQPLNEEGESSSSLKTAVKKKKSLPPDKATSLPSLNNLQPNLRTIAKSPEFLSKPNNSKDHNSTVIKAKPKSVPSKTKNKSRRNNASSTTSIKLLKSPCLRRRNDDGMKESLPTFYQPIVRLKRIDLGKKVSKRYIDKNPFKEYTGGETLKVVENDKGNLSLSNFLSKPKTLGQSRKNAAIIKKINANHRDNIFSEIHIDTSVGRNTVQVKDLFDSDSDSDNDISINTPRTPVIVNSREQSVEKEELMEENTNNIVKKRGFKEDAYLYRKAKETQKFQNLLKSRNSNILPISTKSHSIDKRRKLEAESEALVRPISIFLNEVSNVCDEEESDY